MFGKVPIVLVFDVEPDQRELSPTNRPDWLGFKRLVNWIRPRRRQIEQATGRQATFNWALRLDEQIAHAYGRADWPSTTTASSSTNCWPKAMALASTPTPGAGTNPRTDGSRTMVDQAGPNTAPGSLMPRFSKPSAGHPSSFDMATDFSARVWSRPSMPSPSRSI